MAHVVTADDGQYRFDDVADGDYTLTASTYAPTVCALSLNGSGPHSRDLHLDAPQHLTTSTTAPR
ncbi:peptidase associated/transthyretin-like domain-containing protein [Kineococcus sp. SYSU DK003]|uniref:hypothetical protein n=1 Tax=Kineococcus sp. SYSU DK003 TaxID=3383124 RepID=UPI003D7CE10C